MIFSLYLFFTNYVLPKVFLILSDLLESVILIAVMVVAFIILLRAVGITISRNIGSTILDSISKSIYSIFKTIWKLIIWIIKKIQRLLPIVFKRSKDFFISTGIKPVLATLLATLVTTFVLIIII